MNFAGIRAGAVGLAAALVATAPVAASDAHQLRPHTTASDGIVNVNVKITNDRFIFSRKEGKRGLDARFILVNKTGKTHSFKFGKQGPGAGVQPSVTVPVGPHKRVILTVLLDYPGKVKYNATGADSHKAGMRGYFTIKV